MLFNIHGNIVAFGIQAVAYTPVCARCRFHIHENAAVGIHTCLEVEIARVYALLGSEETEAVAVVIASEQKDILRFRAALGLVFLQFYLLNYSSAAGKGDFYKVVLKHLFGFLAAEIAGEAFVACGIVHHLFDSFHSTLALRGCQGGFTCENLGESRFGRAFGVSAAEAGYAVELQDKTVFGKGEYSSGLLACGPYCFGKGHAVGSGGHCGSFFLRVACLCLFCLRFAGLCLVLVGHAQPHETEHHHSHKNKACNCVFIHCINYLCLFGGFLAVILDGRVHEGCENRTGGEHCAGIFGVILSAHIPAQRRYFNNFYEV